MPDRDAVQSETETELDADLEIRLQESDRGVEQDEEWCEVTDEDGEVRRIRFHDYHEIYAVPGLYEHIFYERLKCESPEAVSGLFQEELEQEGVDPADLTVFDVGAGNGMVATELAKRGFRKIVGVDIIDEAKMAAERDRPGLYEEYLVLDLTAIPGDVRTRLEGYEFDSLTTVAALGFDDMPPLAFAEAYNLVRDQGWLAFNIKERFLEDDEDKSGFSALIQRMLDEGKIERLTERRYRHRLSVSGEPLHYVAIIARKLEDVPLEWAEE